MKFKFKNCSLILLVACALMANCAYKDKHKQDQADEGLDMQEIYYNNDIAKFEYQYDWTK